MYEVSPATSMYERSKQRERLHASREPRRVARRESTRGEESERGDEAEGGERESMAA